MSKEKVGILLVNLGTPASPTPAGVKDFLKSFLSDPLVVRLPRWFWLPLLYCVILPLRSKRVAGLYQKIWWPEGSPLQVISDQQQQALQEKIKQDSKWEAFHVKVAYAPVYGKPSIVDRLQQFQIDGFNRIVVLPLYPQFSSATTGSVLKQLEEAKRELPQLLLQVIEQYFDEDLYIDALVESIKSKWTQQGSAEKLLMSFHGLPQKLIDDGDPYLKHCQKTAHLLAEKLGLQESDWVCAFQSRFGPAKWIQPYSDDVIDQWASAGIKTIDVIAPAFAADCLETLEEIREQYAEMFQEKGGERLAMIPCLNVMDKHITMMNELCYRCVKR